MRFRDLLWLVAVTGIVFGCSSKSTGKSSAKDAGGTDSGSSEAGTDASLDAPPQDAPPQDAPLQDAPPPDAPPPDAPPPDAPPPDGPPVPDAGLPAYTQAVLADAPILYLRFDGPGVDLTSSGAIQPLACQVAVPDSGTLSAGGKVNKALKVGSSPVDCGNVAEFVGKAPFTLEGWFQRLTGDPAAQRLFYRIGIVTSGGQGYALDSAGAGLNLLRLSDGNTATVLGTPALPNGAWTHVAATYNGTQMCVYINAATPVCANSTASIKPVTTTLKIGGGTGSSFTGNIDEIAVYSKALSAARITAHYNAGK